MSHETEERLEHAEHAAHSGQPFDRRVAMTMAMVAAALACVTMLSHRAHNTVLLLAGEANRLQTQAGILHTQASDHWSFYQAKNIRYFQSQSNLALIQVALKDGEGARKAAAVANDWAAQIRKYEAELPTMQADAAALAERARALEETAHQRLEASETWHHRGDRLDLAELGVELALVLCSLAVLSKRTPFWYAGMAIGAVGVAIAATALR
jgi:hypothetical protein